MAMKLLTFRDRGNHIFVEVQLDDSSAVDPDPQKRGDDPNIFRARWARTPPQGLSAAQYRTQIKAEVKLLCQEKLAGNTTDVALAGEGADL